ncbi:hypothetical protein F4821DRAFT_243647 [Hypoxylon rubiginosum]|uniref:Uncharacterized protein n=1 Tax=Hypoxylon rubiginosum TaxID=110542 RepID=A0ACC0CUR1_9PEZI|nr:hypothetical protein F4821DRAFT_243647 [Hypoxylon rubiginosum]
MKVSSILLTLLAGAGLSAAGSLNLPDDSSADGLYVHEFLNDGTVNTTYMGSPATITSRSSSRLDERGTIPIGTPQVNCKNQYNINLSDLQAAEQGLIDAFGSGMTETQKAYTWKYNSAVAYVCNYGKSVTITGSFLQSQFTSVQTQCGLQSGGWVYIKNWAASYGVDQSSASVC